MPTRPRSKSPAQKRRNGASSVRVERGRVAAGESGRAGGLATVIEPKSSSIHAPPLERFLDGPEMRPILAFSQATRARSAQAGGRPGFPPGTFVLEGAEAP